jgi:hypothetical protein
MAAKGGRFKMETSLKKWAKEYKLWVASGETQKAYCKEKLYSLNQFRNQTKEAREAGVLEKSDSQKVGFVPIEVIPEDVINSANKDKPYCEITFSGGETVAFSNRESITGLKELISDLIQA